MKKLYGVMVGISKLIRLFCLPNPFIYYGEGNAVIINWIAEPVLFLITFSVVGIYYFKGTFPAYGSFLYLVFYIIHVGLLMLMGVFHFALWAIILIIILYILAHIGINRLSEGL